MIYLIVGMILLSMVAGALISTLVAFSEPRYKDWNKDRNGSENFKKGFLGNTDKND